VQFIGTTYPFTLNTNDMDNWYGFMEERNQITSFIAANNITGVVFFSADRHWAGVFEVMPGVLEVVVSPVDAFVGDVSASTKAGPDPVLFTAGSSNFVGTFEWNSYVSPPRLNIEVVESKGDNKGGRLYSQGFSLVGGQLKLAI